MSKEDEELFNDEDESKEEEEESSEEVTSELEDDTPAPKNSKASRPMIPKSRLDEVLAKNRQLEQQLKEFTKDTHVKQQEVADQDRLAKLEAQFEALDDEYESAMRDGRQDAKRIRMERNKVERQIARLETTQLIPTIDRSKELEHVAVVARDTSAEQIYVVSLETKYPQLASDSPTYDGELVQSIVDLRNGFLNSGGYTPLAAMKRAIAMHQHLLAPRAGTVASGRKADALKTAIDAATKQPPVMKSPGQGGPKLDKIENMTPEQFAKLTLEQKKRLRGDYAS